MEHILFRGANKKTNKAILEEVRPKFPQHKIHDNIWYRPLQKWDFAAIQKIIKDRTTGGFSIKGCKTLSDIRKAHKAHEEMGKATLVYKKTIMVNKDGITIDRKYYPIQTNASSKREYQYHIIRMTVGEGKRTSIRLDALLEFLGNYKTKGDS